MKVKHHSLTDEETAERIRDYMVYYNRKRIQEKLGYLTPFEYGVKAA